MALISFPPSAPLLCPSRLARCPPPLAAHERPRLRRPAHKRMRTLAAAPARATPARPRDARPPARPKRKAHAVDEDTRPATRDEPRRTPLSARGTTASRLDAAGYSRWLSAQTIPPPAAPPLLPSARHAMTPPFASRQVPT